MKRITIFACICICVCSAMAQTGPKDQLRQQSIKLKKEITALTQQLLQTGAGISNNRLQQQQMNAVLNKRRQLVQSLSNELQVIENEMNSGQKDIEVLNTQLEQLKQQYANAIVYAYEQRNQPNWLQLLFAANSFNEAQQKLQYARYYRSSRAQLLTAIQNKTTRLQQKTMALEATQQQKNKTLNDRAAEVAQLNGRQLNLNQQEKTLLNNQQQLKQQLAAKNKLRVKIEKQILFLVRDNHPKPPVKNKAAKNTDNANVKITARPVSTNFALNKSSLQCPVNGYVFRNYGRYTIENAVGDNTFLSLGTSQPGAAVKAVFEGQVQAVSYMADIRCYVVVIDHGNHYYTAYANLQSASVTKGQAIGTGQTIGGCAANEEKPGEGLLELMLLKGKQVINPGVWILCR
jgi:murein hydrolase activator